MCTTPILLITFNRPQHTRRVLSAILAAEPRDLYVFQDGPREGNDMDRQKCQEVCDVVNELTSTYAVDHHDFTLHTLHPTQNLGCGPGPAKGISWFFENVEQGIIIEDDAVPHPDFYAYCTQLLYKYKEDSQIRAIGSMTIDASNYGDGSYYFSMMNRTLCAWATWRRAWKDFDMYHRDLTRERLNEILKWYDCPLRMREYWCDRLEEIQLDAYYHSSWDQQFWMSIWIHHGKGIVPNVNLCTNIGFDTEATHTTDADNLIANRTSIAILPLIHPTNMSVVHSADINFQKKYFEPWNYGLNGFRRLPYRLNKRLKRIFGHKGSWLSIIRNKLFVIQKKH